MSNNKLFRLGGIAAILSAVVYLLTLGAGFAGVAGALGTSLYIISTLLFMAAVAVLYLDLRGESGPLALAALLLVGVLSIVSLFLDPTHITPVWGPLSLAYGIGMILFGWLQRRSPSYPNGLGLLAVIAGLMAVIAGIALAAGASGDIFGMLNLILTVPYIIWLVWMGRRYLKGNA